MFGGQGKLLNRRPNQKQFNAAIGGRDFQDLEDPDDFQTSSFTRSRVDDDDDNFKNYATESDLFDLPIKRDPSPIVTRPKSQITTPINSDSGKSDPTTQGIDKVLPFQQSSTKKPNKPTERVIVTPPRMDPSISQSANQVPVIALVTPQKPTATPQRPVTPQTIAPSPITQKPDVYNTPQRPSSTIPDTLKTPPKADALTTPPPQTKADTLKIPTPYAKADALKTPPPQTKADTLQTPPPQTKADTIKTPPPQTKTDTIKTPPPLAKEPIIPVPKPDSEKKPNRQEKQPIQPISKPGQKTPTRQEYEPISNRNLPIPDRTLNNPMDSSFEYQSQTSELPSSHLGKSPLFRIESDVYDHDQMNLPFKPAFLRRGKNTPNLIQLDQKLKIIQSDARISSLQCKNARNLKKDLILSEDPSYYDPSTEAHFTDLNYPPNLSQLYQKFSSENNLITFSRVSSLLQQRQVELMGVTDPNGITPGEFRTSGLLTALAGLSEIVPEALGRIFEDQTISMTGFYYVRLFVDGVWRYIVIDDLLARIGDTYKSAGCPQDNRIKKLVKSSVGYKHEIYVTLVEKAVSKLCGSYQDLEISRIKPKDALTMLTGAPCLELSLNPNNLKELQQWLSDYQNKYILQLNLISDNQNIASSFMQKLNASPDLGYTIIGYDKVKGLVTVRNHWGWFKDPNIIKNQLLQVKNPEGESVISLQDICIYFDLLTVSLYKKDQWTLSHGVSQLPNNFSTFSLVVTEDDNDCCISITQSDQTLFRNNLKMKYKYSFARLILLDSDDQIVKSSAEQQKTVFIQAVLQKGMYKVITCIDFNETSNNQKVQLDTVLTYYGQNECQLKHLDYQSNHNLLAKALATQAVNQGETQIFNKTEPNYNQNIKEFLWISQELKLYVLVMSNQGTQQCQYNRYINSSFNKDLLNPLCFVTTEQVVGMTSEQLNKRRKQNWIEAKLVDVNLQTGQLHAIVFNYEKKNEEELLLNQIKL